MSRILKILLPCLALAVTAGCTAVENTITAMEKVAVFVPEFDEERHARMSDRLMTNCEKTGREQEWGCGSPTPVCLGNACKTVRMGAVREGSQCASFWNTTDEDVVLTVRTYWGEQTRMLTPDEMFDFYFGPGCLTVDRVRSTILFYRYQ